MASHARRQGGRQQRPLLGCADRLRCFRALLDACESPQVVSNVCRVPVDVLAVPDRRARRADVRHARRET